MITEYTIGDSKKKWFADKILIHEPILRSYLRRIVPPFHDIDELLLETYGRLLAMADGEIERIRATGELVCRTAHDIVLDRMRRQHVVPLDVMAELESLRTMPSSLLLLSSFEKARNTRQELVLLRRVVGSLPRRCRQIFILCKVHGLSQAAIAVQLGIPEFKVEQQIATGIRLCAARMFGPVPEQKRGLFSRLLAQDARQ